jgi:hypothetical protein
LIGSGVRGREQDGDVVKRPCLRYGRYDWSGGTLDT